MNSDAPPRKLNERTQKHYCVKCLREIPAEEYFGNDFECDPCAKREGEFPLQSTDPAQATKDER